MRFAILLWLFAIGVALPLTAGDRVPQSRADMTFSFVPLVKSAAPAVVNIYAQRRWIGARTARLQMIPFLAIFFKTLVRSGLELKTPWDLVCWCRAMV